MKSIMADNEDKILSEDMNHKLDAILEGIAPLASVPSDIASLKSDVSTIKDDLRVVKAAIKDLSGSDHSKETQLEDHELRITTLEQAA
jgi:hypothetical protein